ncbi:tetratricopeptide repeat protein [Rhodopirellula sp. MGV]|uniref:tetratricopeptide repeat protein n=1 Tax=Rhodopirellula sp. MGV TaxID=2023130 RepID=UPI000B96612C|nr:tetratricopeptide repeat protein [Rhodopirellula sp. MGV]OYP35205.1 hypothetical protein CGZ80_12465 [Rhodopirellula sp. MGV]PNY37781.1 tetratricopeptide repeat protein [Rhodopirellula baltica]
MSATVFDWRAGATILMRSCRGKLLRIVGSSLVTGWLVCLATNIYGQDNQTNDGNVAQAASADETPEQQRERITAERFLTVLLRRPTRGTSLDRVFSYHIGRGDIGELIEGLDDEAETQTDEAAKARYKMVVGLLQSQRGEDAKAVEAFQAATRLTPDDPYAANYLGEALLLVGQESEATEAFANALANDPPKQEYLKIAGALGRLYQRSGQQAEAVAVWKQLEQAFPGDQRVLERIAHILVEEGDLDAALKRFDALAEEARSDNDKIVYAMRAAEFRIRAGDRDQAIKEIERLLSRLRPGSYLHGEARRKIESAFLSSADYAGLASYYEQWVDDHPDDIDATVRLARTLSAQGRTPEAIEWFEQAIERAPSESAPRLALIDAYVAAERYSDAATQYETLTKNDPDNPDHLVHWGQVILQDKDRDADQRAQAAAKVWMRLADARSDDAVVQSQVADLMRNAKLEEQALQRYRAAIKLAPQEPQYKEYLGEYLYRLNRKDEAYEVWQSLAEGELRTRKNLVRLAEILHQFERESDAITVMSEACQMDPTIEERIRFAEWLRDDQQFDPSLEQIKLASDLAETLEDAERVFNEEVKTYQAAGKLQDRIDQLQSNVADSPSDATAWRRLAMLFNANRNAREATDAIEKAIELAPDSIDNLVISAQMYEDAGRLHQASIKGGNWQIPTPGSAAAIYKNWHRSIYRLASQTNR